jgi:hypothetical protein
MHQSLLNSKVDETTPEQRQRSERHCVRIVAIVSHFVENAGSHEGLHPMEFNVSST